MATKTINGREYALEYHRGMQFAVTEREGVKYAVYHGARNSLVLKPLNEEVPRQVLAQEALDQFEGFLPPFNRRGLEALVTGFTDWNVNTPFAMKMAQKLVDHSIPPFYSENFEIVTGDGVAFPVIDQVILLGSGNFAKRIGQKVARQESRFPDRERKDPFFLPSSRAEDVIDFAQKAYDHGEINPQLVRDLSFRLSRSRATPENQRVYSDYQIAALEYLRERLIGLTPIPRTYSREYQPGMDLSFLGKASFWHIDFSPEDRVRIAQDFLERKVKTNSLRGETVERMSLLFPQVFADRRVVQLETQRVRDRYAECFTGNPNYKVPPEVLVDPQFKDLKDDYLQRVEAYIGNIARTNPDLLLSNIENIAKMPSSPQFLTYAGPVAAIIHKHRLNLLHSMDDQQFMSRFDDPHKMASFAGRKFFPEAMANATHTYVVERYRSLTAK
ncbi:hypothetical protein CMO83_00030 [Candidatus Woesearchaeota archaeon]|nr:hypothetical protein [Candidatus Woesearchaeota archaeon]